MNTAKRYIIKQVANIAGVSTQTRYTLGVAYHDGSLLFDDDGRVYLVHGAGDIRVVELNADARSVKSA